MASRLILHEELKEVSGLNNVYFQPPESIKLVYPCIVYKKVTPDQTYANNKMYIYKDCYQVTVIDPDPDTDIPRQMLNYFSLCRAGQNFTYDNLNHYPMTLYY